jgi:hypothetical protein
MDLFHQDDLRALSTHTVAPCVTIMMPTAHVEAELAQNPIRLKNLLKRAGEEMKAQGIRDDEAQQILASARALLDRDDFWRKMNAGLAMFLSPEESRIYRLPVALEELVVVNKRFHLKPLFPLIATNRRFYLLALSRNRVQLFQGTHFTLNEMHVEDIPKSLADALFTDYPEATIKGPVGSKAHQGRPEMMYHGHGQSTEDYRTQSKEALGRYFRKIDEALADVLNDDDAPMLLAGVSYYMPIYREVNSYRGLIEDDLVPGNWEHLNLKDIHERAWQVIEPWFEANQQTAIDRFQELHNNGGRMASTDLKEIVAASVYHRVDTLFVQVGAHQWGVFEPLENAVELHDERQPGDEDLLDLAAVHTFLNRGTVHVVAADAMPAPGQLVAATFRYSPGAPARERNVRHQRQPA